MWWRRKKGDDKGLGVQDALAGWIANGILKGQKCFALNMQKAEKRLTQKQRKVVFLCISTICGALLICQLFLFMLGGGSTQRNSPLPLQSITSPPPYPSRVADSLANHSNNKKLELKKE